MIIPENINKDNIPKHVAIIMDGNGRWAKKKGLGRIFGHKNGVEAVRSAVETAGEMGIEYLTLYAFSTENWERPDAEVQALLSLLVESIIKETPELQKNNVRLRAIGDLYSFPKDLREKLNQAITSTSSNTGLILYLALSYSSKWEILKAVRDIVTKALERGVAPDITASYFEDHLSTAGVPDPELVIRTSGELRTSNFLLWQTAYSEFYFPEVLWPDFRKADFHQAIVEYQKRERRFGKTEDQIK